MDANKSEKLREIGYEIRPACGMCKHADMGSDDDFGFCGVHEYVHLKHTGKPRKLSVYRYGHCSSFEQEEYVENYVHGFKEFLK